MVTEEEYTLIEKAMNAANINNMGAYLRRMAINGYVIRLDLTDVRKMVLLLTNATNNLNQIAKRANETRSIYATDIEDLKTHYENLWSQADKILLGLAKM